MRTLQLTATDARNHFSELAELACYKKQRVLVIRHGRVRAAIVSPEDLELLEKLRPSEPVESDETWPRPPEYLVPPKGWKSPAQRAKERAAEEFAEAKRELYRHPAEDVFTPEQARTFYLQVHGDGDPAGDLWKSMTYWWLKRKELAEGIPPPPGAREKGPAKA